ncbi:MAG: DUF559 domain-containing protein [Solirubrobacteraceae bacterium]|nr:DUF559 domain-containing protein [Solirubrobacteraceae bacterium]
MSFQQLKELGFDYKSIARRRANGSLILDSEPVPKAHLRARTLVTNDDVVAPPSPTQRVYRAPGTHEAQDGRRWRAVLSAPRIGVLDHVSSLELLGIDTFPNAPIHVVVEGGGWDAPRGVMGHRSRSLPAEDLVVVRGLTCTILSRALFAAAPDLRPDRLHDLLDTAVRLGRYDGDAMVRILDSRCTVRGYRQLTAAVAALDATSGTFRSVFERRTTRLVERSQLIPPPVVNVLVDGFRPDLRFVGTRAIIECDGRDYHRSPAQIIADDERQEILEARGFRFLRLRWDDVVYDEEQTLQRIERFVLENLDPPIPGH